MFWNNLRILIVRILIYKLLILKIFNYIILSIKRVFNCKILFIHFKYFFSLIIFFFFLVILKYRDHTISKILWLYKLIVITIIDAIIIFCIIMKNLRSNTFFFFFNIGLLLIKISRCRINTDRFFLFCIKYLWSFYY